jgi:tetratricopeptide (TPR) repeat protein
MEMNAYLKNGKLAELVKKMEDALVGNADNADINFNLALLYLGMANPKEGAKPANGAELYGKAEGCFKKAMAASPENANYAYNFGTLYYMQAYDVNEQMNNITGTSPAEMKKYDELKKQRDGLFGKAQPQMEKAYSVFSTGTVKDSDKDTYRACLVALKQMYAVADNKAKKDEVSAKLDALDK